MAVLWAVEQFKPYLWGRKFTLITDCSALTWLFMSQTLSPKLRRWALRLMEYDTDVQWKAGQYHHLPDSLLRLPRFETSGEDIGDSFPGDASDRQTYRGARGPILDGGSPHRYGNRRDRRTDARTRGGSSGSHRHTGHVTRSRQRGQGGPRGAAFGTRETNRGGPLLRGAGAASLRHKS